MKSIRSPVWQLTTTNVGVGAVKVGDRLGFNAATDATSLSLTVAETVTSAPLGFQTSSVNYSVDVPKTIDASSTETAPVTSEINVTAPGQVTDLVVTLDISHTWDADVKVFLVPPLTNPITPKIELFSNVGGSGDNFFSTTLDDDAPLSILEGQAPFTGVYRPVEVKPV